MRRWLLPILLVVASAACSPAADPETVGAPEAIGSTSALGSDAARVLASPDGEAELGPRAAASPSGDSSSDLESVEESPDETTVMPDGAESEAPGPDSESDSVSTTDAETADTTDEPNDSDGDAEPASGETTSVDDLVDDLIAFVEDERGHQFLRRPTVEILTDSAFVSAWSDVVEADVAATGSEYGDYTDIHRALGIIEPGEDLASIWASFGDAGVLGWYDPSRETVVLRGNGGQVLVPSVLVHELVHALDDQLFDIDRADFDGRDDELTWTHSAIVEGSAIRIEDRFVAQLTAAERAAEDAAVAAVPRGVSLLSFSDPFLELQLGRLESGRDFVEVVWDAGGAERLDAAFTSPPATSEAVIDPSLWLSGTSSDSVAVAPVGDGPIFRQGTWGEARFAALFTEVLGVDEAYEAADGWGGDAWVAWRSGEATCVRLHVEADSAAELDQLADAIELWAAESVDRRVFYPTADLIRLTACG